VGDETIVTVRVTGDAALTVDEQVVDLEQLSKLITSKSNCKTVIVVVPPDCTAALMGEISQTCLASGADEVKIVREAMEESP
jgi:biopolymer transport protein ExbD